EEEYRNQVKDTLLILWNSYKYFVLYANQHILELRSEQDITNILDKWILIRLKQTGLNVARYLDSYNTPASVREIHSFIQDVSTWYIRRSRDRFAAGDNDALSTLFVVLSALSTIAAPIMPFVTEEIYRNLTREESVHLTNYPVFKIANEADEKILNTMRFVQQIASLGNAKRKEAKISIRQPLSNLTVASPYPQKAIEQYEKIIKDELNVKHISWIHSNKEQSNSDELVSVKLDTTITPELKDEGDARNLIRQVQGLRKKEGFKLDDRIVINAPEWPKQFEEHIKEKTLADRIEKSDSLSIALSSRAKSRNL
ncbi:MAG: class I tRNA ligase family protein, partial [Candidatus Roizmanbacteria bacterium]|nr:class I tRNA ligase family protein [Candidatus Roizmanbacteria bacterium]